jgi:hypothetical protein
VALQGRWFNENELDRVADWSRMRDRSVVERRLLHMTNEVQIGIPRAPIYRFDSVEDQKLKSLMTSTAS